MELTDPAAKTSQERKYDILESATHICMRFLDNKKKLLQGDKDGDVAGVLGIHHYLWIRLDLSWKSFMVTRTKDLEPPHEWRSLTSEEVSKRVADVFSRLKLEHVQVICDSSASACLTSVSSLAWMG